MSHESDHLLTTHEAMEILGVCKNTIYKYIHDGVLPAHKLGKVNTRFVRDSKRRLHWRIKKSDLDAFINGRS